MNRKVWPKIKEFLEELEKNLDYSKIKKEDLNFLKKIMSKKNIPCDIEILCRNISFNYYLHNITNNKDKKWIKIREILEKLDKTSGYEKLDKNFHFLDKILNTQTAPHDIKMLCKKIYIDWFCFLVEKSSKSNNTIKKLKDKAQSDYEFFKDFYNKTKDFQIF
jgi:hypothetical protein